MADQQCQYNSDQTTNTLTTGPGITVSAFFLQFPHVSVVNANRSSAVPEKPCDASYYLMFLCKDTKSLKMSLKQNMCYNCFCALTTHPLRFLSWIIICTALDKSYVHAAPSRLLVLVYQGSHSFTGKKSRTFPGPP